MPRSPLDTESFRRLQAWWLDLPLSYRVNTALYLLGAVGIVVVLFNLIGGDDNPRETRVAAGLSATTTTSRIGVTTTRFVPASTSTTVPGATTTTAAPAAASGGTSGGGTAGVSSGGGGGTSGGTSDGGASGGGGGGDGGGGGGGGGGGDGGGGSNPTTTTTALVCRNSTDARCGFFYWDPQPINQAPQIGPSLGMTAAPVAGQAVTFSVTVSEPDHSLANACALWTFGDGTTSGSCPTPPCTFGGKFGPWTPPDRPPAGMRTFSVQHTYANPGSYTLMFELESRDSCEDPYGTTRGLSFGRWPVVVAAPTTTTRGT